MPVVKKRNAEPIPGYRLIEPLGKGGFGEVWKCEAPGGLFKAIKFVYGNMNGLEADRAQAEVELRAIERIKSIRHPFLLSLDRVECIDGELMVVTELADKNLHDVLLANQRQGRAGLPRAELLGYLREAAEALDIMNFEHQLQHVDIKPHNLFLVSNHVKVADFGLVKRQAGGRTRHSSVVPIGAVTPLYASPEVFLGKVSPQSDQYSLAIVYQELLTGRLPFTGKNSRQLLMQHMRGEPDLSSLPECDRPIVLRALSKKPDQRYPSCTAFVQALLDVNRRARTGEFNNKRPKQMTAQRAPPAPRRHPENSGNGLGETEIVPSRITIGDSAPALAGYQLLESLGSTPLADTWRARAPDGRIRLLKFIYGLGHGRDLNERRARLEALAHPALMPMEIIQADPGRLAIITDRAEQTLRDRWQECQSRGLPGMERQALVAYLSEAAHALGELESRDAVYHLGLNPRALLLHGRRLRISDFGLAHLLWLPARQDVAQRNARYAAPELFARQAHRNSDQYSLAVIFHEMLTGSLPAPGQMGKSTDQQTLSAADRDILSRALDPDPERRWPSCAEMMQALRAASDANATRHESAELEALSATDLLQPRVMLNNLIEALLSARRPGGDNKECGRAVTAGEELTDVVQTTMGAEAARACFDTLRRQWFGQVIRESDAELVFHVSLPSNFWRTWIGRQPGLEVAARLTRSAQRGAGATEVQARVRPFRCSKRRSTQLLADLGQAILEDLRSLLRPGADKRIHERVPWPETLRVSSVSVDGALSEPVECRAKDVSLTGISFFLPRALPTANIRVYLPTRVSESEASIPATLVWAQRVGDGSYDVGAVFCLDRLSKSEPAP
jgi:serine/threonine protein kinase